MTKGVIRQLFCLFYRHFGATILIWTRGPIITINVKSQLPHAGEHDQYPRCLWFYLHEFVLQCIIHVCFNSQDSSGLDHRSGQIKWNNHVRVMATHWGLFLTNKLHLHNAQTATWLLIAIANPLNSPSNSEDSKLQNHALTKYRKNCFYSYVI